MCNEFFFLAFSVYEVSKSKVILTVYPMTPAQLYDGSANDTEVLTVILVIKTVCRTGHLFSYAMKPILFAIESMEMNDVKPMATSNNPSTKWAVDKNHYFGTLPSRSSLGHMLYNFTKFTLYPEYGRTTNRPDVPLSISLQCVLREQYIARNAYAMEPSVGRTRSCSSYDERTTLSQMI